MTILDNLQHLNVSMTVLMPFYTFQRFFPRKFRNFSSELLRSKEVVKVAKITAIKNIFCHKNCYCDLT